MIPKGYKHTGLGILPQDWEVVRLGEVCEIKKDKFNPQKQEAIPCIELEHISQDTGVLLGFVNSDEQLSIKNFFSKGDILFGKLRPYLRKFWKALFDGVCSSEIWVFQGKKASNEFLFYLVQTARFSQIANATCGTKMPRADWGLMQNEVFPLPPLAEQEKIAEILSTWDTQIQNYESLIKEKKTLKKGLCQTLLTAKTRLKGFNEDWKTLKLQDIFSILKGTGLTKDDITPNGKFKCILYGELYTMYSEVIKQATSLTNLKIGILSKSGDILIPASTTTGATEIAIATSLEEEGVLLGGDINILRPKTKDICSAFIARLLREVYKSKIASFAQGTTIIHLYASNIQKISIQLPPLAEQEKIAEILDGLDNEITLLEQKLESLKSQKKGLMQKLLSGKIRVAQCI